MKKRGSEKDKDKGLNVEVVHSTKAKEETKNEKNNDLMKLFDNLNPTQDFNSSLAQINVSNEEKDIIDEEEVKYEGKFIDASK